MIREFNINDIDNVMEIWLETNIITHNYIKSSYWESNYNYVKKMILQSTVLVYENNNEIYGFIGITDSYIAGIFVNIDWQSKGIGKQLINHVKKNHDKLYLQVYKKNIKAIEFYQREKFVIESEQTDENTGELEFIMIWKKQ